MPLAVIYNTFMSSPDLSPQTPEIKEPFEADAPTRADVQLVIDGLLGVLGDEATAKETPEGIEITFPPNGQQA